MLHHAAHLILLLALLPFACAKPDKNALTPPQSLLSPYSTSGANVIFAVVPPRNESGSSIPDVLAFADELAAQLEQVRGVRCLATNRTVDAMRTLKLSNITSPAQARALAAALGADAILVPTITAYDPYVPTIGLAAALYGKEGFSIAAAATPTIDPRQRLNRPTDSATPTSAINRSLSSVSNHFDGNNHQVQADLALFAAGRQKGPSATGWKRALFSMPDYITFCCYRTTSDLMQAEWIRLAKVPLADNADNSPTTRNERRQTLDTQRDTIAGSENNPPTDLSPPTRTRTDK